jgi:DNA repair protein RadC
MKKAIDDFGMLDLIKYLNSLNLTKSQRRKLELLNLYHKRMLTSNHKEKPVLSSSSKAGEFALNLFTDKAYECFYLICLDSQNRVNKAVAVHEGTINESPVYPRLIVEHALAYRANSVILSHNHPGGSQSPSQADIEVTKRIKQAMEAISIKVMDHIIVADARYTSFAEKGLL